MRIRVLATIALGIALIWLFPQGVTAEIATVEIGQPVRTFVFKDIRYLPRTLDEFGKRDAFVIVFTSTNCPHVNAAFRGVGEMEKAYRGKNVEFLGINVNPAESMVQVADHAI